MDGRQAYLPLSAAVTEETSSVDDDRDVGSPKWRAGGDVSTVTPPRGDV